MERQTLRDLRAALNKQPEQRTKGDHALIESFRPAEKATDSVARTLSRHAKELELSGGLKQMGDHTRRLQDQIPSTPPFDLSFPPAGDTSNLLEKYSKHQAREKAEQRQREIETVEELRAIRSELEQARQEPQKLAGEVEAHEEELAKYRTGLSGRPGSSHLLVDEFQRRVAAGDIEDTLKEQARVLIQWLDKAHPLAHPITEKTAENKLRADYRRARKPTNRR